MKYQKQSGRYIVARGQTWRLHSGDSVVLRTNVIRQITTCCQVLFLEQRADWEGSSEINPALRASGKQTDFTVFQDLVLGIN